MWREIIGKKLWIKSKARGWWVGQSGEFGEKAWFNVALLNVDLEEVPILFVSNHIFKIK